MKFRLWSPKSVRNKNRLGFGITEAIVAGSLLASAVGTTAATALVGAGLGAATGAGLSAITGGNPLTGALTGGLGGALGPLAGAAGDAIGIGSTAGAALGGAASGALSGAITGGNPLTSAIMGGGQAALMSGLSSMGSNSSLDNGLTGASGVDVSGTGAGGVSGVGDAGSAAATSGTDGLNISGNPADSVSGGNNISGGAGNSGAGALSAATNYANATPAQQVSANINSEGSGLAAGASSPNSPGFLSKVSNYLFGAGTPTNPSVGNVAGIAGGGSGTTSGAPGTGGSSSGVLGGIANKLTANPLQTALLGMQLLNMANKPSTPNLSQQQASTQPASWNSPLPSYQNNITRTPINNYYTYGYSAQPAQFTNTLTPTTPMKTGGKVQKLAPGGIAAPRVGAPRIRIPHAGAPMRRRSGAGIASLGAISKLHSAQQAATGMGAAPPMMAKGGALRMHPTFMAKGQVAMGTGTSGTADKIPAMLSEDEYVVPADVTSHLGNGSSNGGARVLDKFVKDVRQSRGAKSKGLPPSAKTPQQYMGAKI